MGDGDGWTPPVVRTSAIKEEGIDELWEAIEGHRAWLERSGGLVIRRRDRLVAEVREMAAQALARRVEQAVREDGDMVVALQERRTDPYAAAAAVVARARVLEA
jgi:LAO/AO transport system kinase